MFKIEHLAIWVKDLEKMKAFYTHWFGFQSNNKYVNPTKGFSSYFLQAKENNHCRIELMASEKALVNAPNETFYGLAHIALSVGSERNVDELTENMRAAGVNILGEPRWTGDGYYESVVEDPEGNKIELTK